MSLVLSTQKEKYVANDKNPISKPDHCEDDYKHDMKVLTNLNKTLIKKDEDLANIVKKYTDTIDSEEENKDGGNSTGANQ